MNVSARLGEWLRWGLKAAVRWLFTRRPGESGKTSSTCTPRCAEKTSFVGPSMIR